MRERLRGWMRHDYLVMSALCLATAGLIVLPMIVTSGGLFTVVGDFNYQQIPFNILSNRAIKSGDIFWNWSTDLGSNFIGSYSFYTLGSPFFWLSMLFPPFAFPYLVGPMFLLKYTVAGLLAFTYMRRYVKNSHYAMIGALLYAFSGFTTVNLMFNHFHDVVAFFPLLLIGLDRLVIERRPGLFAAAVALNAFLNFFFFMCELFFLILYVVIRFLLEDFKRSVRRLPAVCLEGALGIGMACALFLPAVYFTLQNPRLGEFLYGPSAIAFDGSRYLEIIKAVLMPADIMPHQSAIFEQDFTSSSAYLPLFGVSAVVAFMLAKRGAWQKRLICMLALIACVPLLDSFFYALNGCYYARWFYMPVLMMAMMTAQVLEEREAYPAVRATVAVAILTAALAAFLAFYPWSASEKNGLYDTRLFIVYVCLTGAGLLVSYCLFRMRPLYRARVTASFVIVFAAGAALFNLYAMHGIFTDQSPEAINDSMVKTGEQLAKRLPKSENYRISLDDGGWNVAMISATPTVNSFTSMVNGSIFQFYQSLGSPRQVKTISPDGAYGLIPLLSNRFYVTRTPMSGMKLYTHFYNGTSMVYVYEYTDTLPIGFTYDDYLTAKQFAGIPQENRHLALLKAVVVSGKDARTVATRLQPLPASELFNLNRQSFLRDVAERRGEAATSFHRYTTGFSATIQADAAKYAFFSVPYDSGWQATVNGVHVKILNADGLMIVPIAAGSNHIQFSYMTPGLQAGVGLSLVSLFIYAGWMLTCTVQRRRRAARRLR
ncbi:MAG: YfhO family protein [Sporolactobacillus sp.]